MANDSPSPLADNTGTPRNAGTAEAVLRFLESVGRSSEADLYVRLFRQLPKESFAVIAPGAPVIRQGLGAFTEQLRFLADLGLSAPVVIGLYDPTQSTPLADRLQKRAESAALGPIRHSAGEPDLTDRLRLELRAGKLPIVELTDAQNEPIADRVGYVARLTAELDTRKLVLLRRRGPLHLSGERAQVLADRHQLMVDSTGLSLINLRTDSDLVLGQRLLRRDDATLLESVRDLLTQSQAARLLVSITSPLDLLRELFTVKGAGTLVKRGSPIVRVASYAEIETARLELLLKSSFGHELHETFFARAPLAVFVEQDYRAAAILRETELAPYLSKFAVDPVAQGEGMGRDLWAVVSRDFPKMFWRTRADNPISSWYATVCDGLVRDAAWHIFWRGLEPGLVPELVNYARLLGDDFVR